MGLILAMQTITGEDIPVWFTESDSKILVRELSDFVLGYDGNLSQLLGYLKLELPALKKLSDYNGKPYEFYRTDMPIQKREQILKDAHLARGSTWQDPKEIIVAIEYLLIRLDLNQNIFSQAGIIERYYLDGSFQQDMIDLQKMATWAHERGIESVRLLIR